MNFPRIYVDEPLPAGYDGSVRVLANLTTKELMAWFGANLGIPGCPDCANAEDGRCATCAAARAAFGASITLIYGPTLLGEDVSTPDKALAVFDNDDALPAELVAWLYVLPDAIRERRVTTIRKNARSSSEPIETS